MKKLISWVEIPARDMERALSQAPDFLPSKNGVLVSLNMEDGLDKALAGIEELGGKIVRPKTKIEAEGRGYFALFIDSEGNKVGLYGDA